MGTLDAAARLNASLDEVAAALSAPDADALVGAEAGLASALAELSRHLHGGTDDRARLVGEVARARGTLARCRILGASLADAARLTLHAHGHGDGYGRSGEPAREAAGIRGHRLRTRL
jgi:hypothetical protein